MRIKKVQLLPLILLILALTGCVKVDVGMKMDGSTKGQFAEQIVVLKTGLAESGLTPSIFDSELEKLDTDGVNVEDIDGKEYVGKRISFEFSSFKDLDQKLSKVFKGAEDTLENTNDDVNKVGKYVIERGSEVELNMPAETFISGTVGQSKYSYSIDGTFYMDMGNLEVISSNADKVEGSRYEWKLVNRESNIKITYKRVSGGLLLGVLGGLLLIVLVIVIMYIKGRSR